jgi:hypothetical protein
MAEISAREGWVSLIYFFLFSSLEDLYTVHYLPEVDHLKKFKDRKSVCTLMQTSGQ